MYFTTISVTASQAVTLRFMTEHPIPHCDVRGENRLIVCRIHVGSQPNPLRSGQGAHCAREAVRFRSS